MPGQAKAPDHSFDLSFFSAADINAGPWCRSPLTGLSAWHFVEFARRHGCKPVKAITTPSNFGAIAFHRSLGMQLLGESNVAGISVVPDYAGLDEPRVVF
jgi:hypothetical protein